MSVAVISESQPVEEAAAIHFRSSTANFLFRSGTGWLLILASIVSLGIALIGVLPYLGYRWLKNRTSTYVLEGGRLFMRQGIIMRREDEIELYRIKDIKADFSIFQQMFNTGDLTITSTDGTGSANWQASIRVADLTDARGLREELRKRVERSRKRHAVREID